MPVEDEDRGARALVEGGLGEDVHAGIDQPDEQHRGVHLAAAHGAVAACLEEMMDGVSASTVVPVPWLSSPSLYIRDHY